MKICMDKCNIKHYVALPFALIAYLLICIVYLITGENVECYRIK